MPRRNSVILDKPGDLFGDNGGLAAARTGQYQQWAIDILYSGFLLRVQIGSVRECDTEYFISGGILTANGYRSKFIFMMVRCIGSTGDGIFCGV